MAKPKPQPWLTLEQFNMVRRLRSSLTCQLKPLMTTNELADVLRCSRQTVDRMCADGTLPFLAVGTRRRFIFEEVREALANRPRRHLGPTSRITGPLH